MTPDEARTLLQSCDEDRDVFGLKRGESVPMAHRGEAGYLYRPVIELTITELTLYGKAHVLAEALPAHEDTRDNFLRITRSLVEQSVADTDSGNAMIDRIMAFADEMADL